MTTLSWNCRGMGLSRKVQFLYDVVRQEQPIFVFLCETMAKRSRMEWVRNKLGFEGMVTVDPVGKSGGLALMWKDKDQTELISFSQSHIDVKVHLEDMGEWRLTGMYGEPDRSRRRNTWDLLRNLARDANLPWCVLGDLNNVLSVNDKRGGDPYLECLIEGFNAAICDANLVDLELSGYQYTWERGRNTESWMECRFDRALTTEHWLNLFPMANLYNLEGASSDHSALLLVPQMLKQNAKTYKFKFENAWTTEPMCEILVREG